MKVEKPGGERESRGDAGGKDEVDVKGEDDREGGDVTHPRGPRFAGEMGEGVRGENEGVPLAGDEDSEVGV
jgi:hypothetical protein